MKVLFVIPPHPTRREPVHDGMPLGILYLASLARQNNEIKIIDLWSFPDDEILHDTLKKYRPDIAAVSVPFKMVERTSVNVCKTIRTESNAKIIVGGIHASLAHKRIRKNLKHDYFIYGEGEVPFSQLIRNLADDVETVPENVFKPGENLNSVKTPLPDVDALPFPARDLLPGRENYAERLITSRGCGFGCGFCSSRKFWGGFRGRSPDSIVDELEQIYSERGLVQVSFADDSFTFNRERVINFCQRMNERNVKTAGLGFSSHPERLDDELLEKMREIGFDSLFLGLESGSKSVLRNIGKYYSAGRIEKLINKGLSLGYSIHASFMIGLPGETRADIEKTLTWVESLPLKSIGFHIFYPFDGCPIRENPGKYGITIDERSEHDGDIDGEAVINNGVLSQNEILDYYYRARALARMKAEGK